jgi:hypothetical protein
MKDSKILIPQDSAPSKNRATPRYVFYQFRHAPCTELSKISTRGDAVLATIFARRVRK